MRKKEKASKKKEEKEIGEEEEEENCICCFFSWCLLSVSSISRSFMREKRQLVNYLLLLGLTYTSNLCKPRILSSKPSIHSTTIY